MGFWKEMFGGGADAELSEFDGFQGATRAEDCGRTARMYKSMECMEGLEKSEYMLGKMYYDGALAHIEGMRKQAVLRPLVPSRITFDRALDEYSRACEAMAHQKLIGASDRSELAYAVRLRFNTARTALMALVFESDISKEELDRRVAELMGEDAPTLPPINE